MSTFETYTDADIENLEAENERLRRELEAHERRQAAAQQANAGEADWQAKLAGAANPDEVVAIMDERRSTLTTGPTEAEMEAAHRAHSEAMAQVASPEEAHRLHMEFVRANPWAGE